VKATGGRFRHAYFEDRNRLAETEEVGGLFHATCWYEGEPMSLAWEEMVPKGGSTGESATGVFLAWEKYRLLYNAILAAETCLLASGEFGNIWFWVALIEGVVVANVCYCVGPVAEGYLSLLGANRKATRIVLFVSGTLLATLLTVLALVLRMAPLMAIV
jgi:hypothetical protein